VHATHKSGMAKPKAPQQAPPEGETVIGKQYLSEVGLFQRQVYGLLVLRRYPADYAVLRELSLRWPQEAPREARLERGELEHVEKAVGSWMMKLARALDEGPESEEWRPRPGGHCNKCPVGRSCPVPPEMRGDGAITTDEEADEAARTYVVAKAQYSQAASQLKAREEAGCRPGRANEREEVRWGPDASAWTQKGNGRKFGLWPRESEGSNG
jgi:hypothetical protein